MIKIINLYKDYLSSTKNVTHALKNINLELPDKGFVSILGPSGCGKSTLLNLLGALDSPTKGRVYIDGTLINELNDNEKDILRNKYIGFVFQSYHLINTLNAKENVELPLLLNTDLDRNEILKRVDEAFASVNLNEQKEKKSNELSGGQMQRIAIARALINDSKIVLADEPTGALDSKNSIVVMDLLKEISKDRLVVCVTHNIDLAEQYSDEIIKLKDGEIVDKICKNPLKVQDFCKKPFEKPTKKNFFASENIIYSLSFKNMFSKKLKTVLTAVANCFGLVSLGLILSLTHGFSVYSEKVSEATSSFLPVNVPAYTVKGDETEWMDINQSKKYPEALEIYPYVTSVKENDYTYNVYTQEYISLLDSLVERGLASEYLINYGNDYSYNLVTNFPASIDGKPGGYYEVDTSISAGGSYTKASYGIPTNIFHPIYGRVDEMYDLIAGKAPTNKNELVLIVDSYNSINFDTLKNLGFYNLDDTQEEVMKKTLETKVVPISFADIVGDDQKPAKKYKVFTNDEFYSDQYDTKEVEDFFSTSSISSTKEIKQFHVNDLEQLYSDKGTELTVVGVMRPKDGSAMSLLSPSLCYLPELQDDLTKAKKESVITSKILDNLIGVDNNTHESRKDFINDMTALATRYQNGKADINASTFNEIVDRYFEFHPITDDPQKGIVSSKLKFSEFLTVAKSFGADLIEQETIDACLSGDKNKIYTYFSTLYNNFYKPSLKVQNYQKLVSLGAFLNAYSDILNISIFPKGIEQRQQILVELNAFNESKGSEADKVYYYDYQDPMLRTMGNMIGLVQMNLTIFVVVLVIVACAMNILFTYNSVLERKKDIGILRAVGTSKANVSKLFIIESGFIGLISGLFSSLFAYLLTYPINFMSLKYFEDYFTTYNKIAVMTWYHPLILVGIGLLLGILSSLIPSYSAAKKDPVECLRDN